MDQRSFACEQPQDGLPPHGSDERLWVAQWQWGPQRSLRGALTRARRALQIVIGTVAITGTCAGGALLLGTGAASASSPNESQLRGQLSTNKASSSVVRQRIQADDNAIERIEGRVSVLASRQSTLQNTVDFEDGQLAGLRTKLSSTQLRLKALRESLGLDYQALAAELLAQYESPPPDLTTVLFESHGFADLLERVSQLKDIVHQDVTTADTVRDERAAVTAETIKLKTLQADHQRLYAAALYQRNEISEVRLATVKRELNYARARGKKNTELANLTNQASSLQSQLTTLQKQEAAAEAAPSASYVPSGDVPADAGTSTGPFVPHGGEYGLFLAPGTNYTVNEEPEIAARLDKLGIALHLHLIGISGYRTPEHSVAVGGFADDPHTKGEASDTPGIEGVPESVLEQFGLERPFPGAHEADHIQLLGSIPVDSY
jgi:peptidoglycan hydrolase CwlO-like protein